MGRANTGTDAPNNDPFGHNGHSVYPPQQDQINNRMKTMGYFDPAQMGKMMTDAVAAGIIQAQKMLAEQPGATHEQRWEGVREYGYHRFPARGVRGLIGTAGALMAGRFVWNSEQGQNPPGLPRLPGPSRPSGGAQPEGGPPLSDAQQAAASVAEATQAAQAAAAQTGAPPPPSPQGPSEVVPGVPGPAPSTGIGGGIRIGNRYWGAGAWSGSTNAPQAPQAPQPPQEAPEAPQEAPEAPEAPLEPTNRRRWLPPLGTGATAVGSDTAEAQMGTTVASEAAEATAAVGRGRITNAVGQALIGFGARGMPGAWEGLAGALPEAAGVLGPVGLAYTAATGVYEGINQLGNFVAGQRQQGAYWQSILGGSNLSGQMQRAQQIGFRFSQLGNLSGAQANALFQGVTNLDMTGAQRANAMQQAVQMYDQLGVSIQTSLQNITIAAQSGNKELTGLAEAITNVSNVAAAAGVSGNVARGIFTSNYQAATNAGLVGPGGTAVAGGLTAAQVGLGPQYNNADFSGLYSQQTMMMLASAGGYSSYDAFLSAILSGHPGAYGKAMTNLLGQFAAPSTVDPYIDAAAKKLKLMGALQKGQLTPENLKDLTVGVMSLDPNDFSLVAQAAGQAMQVNLPNSEAYAQWFVSFLTGNYNPQTAGPSRAPVQFKTPRGVIAPPTGVNRTPAQERAFSQQFATEAYNKQVKYVTQQIDQTPGATKAEKNVMLQHALDQLKQDPRYKPGGAFNNPAYAEQQYNAAFMGNKQDLKQYQEATTAIGAPTGLSALKEDLLGPNYQERAQNWYRKNLVEDQGQRSKAMEYILKNPSLSNADTLYWVQTNKGRQLATAQDLQQHYLNQVNQGTVQVATGQYRGKLISSIEGFAEGKQLTDRTGDTAAEERRLRAQYNREHKADLAAQQKVLGTVIIKPSAQLQTLLGYQTSGNVAMDNSTSINQTAPGHPATPSSPNVANLYSGMQG
jgi:hypothetical protein